jgi:hypothetical protein
LETKLLFFSLNAVTFCCECIVSAIARAASVASVVVVKIKFIDFISMTNK